MEYYEGGIHIELKKIKLSPKRGGNGFVSSYSVNLGSNEAKMCGLVNQNGEEATVIKIIDPAKQEVIIRFKRCTLTRELVQYIVDQAECKQRAYREMMEAVPHNDGVVDMSDIPSETEECSQRYLEAETLMKNRILELPLETITDLMTLMYMGRDSDADMQLPPEDRFVDYWSYLYDTGVFADGAEYMATHMIEKLPLAEYLRCGLEIMERSPQESEIDIDEGY